MINDRNDAEATLLASLRGSGTVLPATVLSLQQPSVAIINKLLKLLTGIA